MLFDVLVVLSFRSGVGQTGQCPMCETLPAGSNTDAPTSPSVPRSVSLAAHRLKGLFVCENPITGLPAFWEKAKRY